MKVISFILIFFAFQSFGQISRYSTPPQLYVPSTDLGLSNVIRGLEQANARAEANYNQIQPLMDLNREILEDKIKTGCDNRIIDYYNNYIDILEKRGYSLGSPQDISSLKSELGKLRSALISFDCNKPTPTSKYESVSNNYSYQNFIGKGVIISGSTSVWDSYDIAKANLVKELDKNVEVNIVGIYKGNIIDYYQIILDNGKSGYVNTRKISIN